MHPQHGRRDVQEGSRAYTRIAAVAPETDAHLFIGAAESNRSIGV
jgi:hypothetical protein